MDRSADNFTVRGFVSGQVQGVGFRNHVKQRAAIFQLSGRAINLPDGRVEVLLSGPRDKVIEVQKAVAEGPKYSRVDNLCWETVEAPSMDKFHVG